MLWNTGGKLPQILGFFCVCCSFHAKNILGIGLCDSLTCSLLPVQVEKWICSYEINFYTFWVFFSVKTKPICASFQALGWEMKYLVDLPHHPPSEEILPLGIVCKLGHKIQNKTDGKFLGLRFPCLYQWKVLFIYRFHLRIMFFKNIRTLSTFPSIIFRCRAVPWCDGSKTDWPSVNVKWWFVWKETGRDREHNNSCVVFLLLSLSCLRGKSLIWKSVWGKGSSAVPEEPRGGQPWTSFL